MLLALSNEVEELHRSVFDGIVLDDLEPNPGEYKEMENKIINNPSKFSNYVQNRFI